MNNKYNIGDIVIANPYRDSPQIKVVGYIVKIGRGIINKIPYVKIKGVKRNTYNDFIKFSIKIYQYNFDLIKIIWIDEKQ